MYHRFIKIKWVCLWGNLRGHAVQYQGVIGIYRLESYKKNTALALKAMLEVAAPNGFKNLYEVANFTALKVDSSHPFALPFISPAVKCFEIF